MIRFIGRICRCTPLGYCLIARLTYLDFRKFRGWDDYDEFSDNDAVYAWPMTLFSGHSFISICVVANLAFGGLLVSHIIKNVRHNRKSFRHGVRHVPHADVVIHFVRTRSEFSYVWWGFDCQLWYADLLRRDSVS